MYSDVSTPSCSDAQPASEPLRTPLQQNVHRPPSIQTPPIDQAPPLGTPRATLRMPEPNNSICNFLLSTCSDNTRPQISAVPYTTPVVQSARATSLLATSGPMTSRAP